MESGSQESMQGACVSTDPLGVTLSVVTAGICAIGPTDGLKSRLGLHLKIARSIYPQIAASVKILASILRNNLEMSSSPLACIIYVVHGP